MKCPECQSDNADTARFCSYCAAPLTGGPSIASPKTMTIQGYAKGPAKGILIAGKYELLEPVGKGGMGEVYRAEDVTLSRQVAVKVLPEAFAADEERLARFAREARVLASLNHPNIAAIYGIEEADGKRFLILELVEGETLAERLFKGALPLEETLEVCRQIAEGVEAAHEKGVIHRDLKPANVKITPEGKVKILDFGLAKGLVDELTATDVANSPTITANMTQPGVILGTAAYMSPEQATGRPVDKRADIWAFGCILYECLTGKRAFLGDTVTESLASILRGEPDWDALPAGIPQNVRAVLRRCFQKNPRDRLRDIGDARLEITEPADQLSEAATPSRRLPLPWLAAGVAGALIAGIAIGMALIRNFRRAPAPLLITSTVKVEPGHWLDGMRRAEQMQRPSRTAMAISSDGRFIVYSAIEENPSSQSKPRLYLRRMDQPEARPITGTEGGINPFLSPDDRWAGFWADGKLKKVPVEGGVPTPLCDAWILMGADWGPDNTIVFAGAQDSGLGRVSAEGGQPEWLTTPDPKRDEGSHRLPSWLPDGKAVLFTIMKNAFDSKPGIALFRLATREWKVLLPDGADAKYVPTGHLAFLREGTLMAVRFDLDRLEVVGQPAALVENVMQAYDNAGAYHTCAGQYGISGTGSLIYAAGGVVPEEKNVLVWLDKKGDEQPVTDLRFPFIGPRLSPDGRKIAYVTGGREQQIWVYDLARGTNSRLTGEGFPDFPIWSSDGQRILFGWQKSSLAPNLFGQPYDGSSPMERLTTSECNQHIGSMSPDGKTLAFIEWGPSANNTWSANIVLLDTGSGRVTPFLNSPAGEIYPEFSPDGRWVAYASDESGRFEVYVRPFPGPGLKHQVSSEGAEEPLWARDGKQLFYRGLAGTPARGQVWVVDVRADGGFATSKPRLLFHKPGYQGGNPMRGYDLSADGQRFLMVRLEQKKPAPVTEMVLVQNWFEELKRLLPTGRK